MEISKLTPKTLAKYLDYAFVTRPGMLQVEYDKMIDECIEYGFEA